MDVEATTTIRQAEVGAAKTMLDRQRLERLAGLDENRLVAGRGLQALG